MNSPFAVLKLITGDTIFAEIMDLTDYSYVVKHPRIVKLVNVGPGGKVEGYSLTPWVPFTNDEIFEIKDNIVYYIGELNENSIKFYGATLMREEISKLNIDGQKRVESGEYGYTVLKEVLDAIRELGEDYSIKYGISPVDQTITDEDLSSDRILN